MPSIDLGMQSAIHLNMSMTLLKESYQVIKYKNNATIKVEHEYMCLPPLRHTKIYRYTIIKKITVRKEESTDGVHLV